MLRSRWLPSRVGRWVLPTLLAGLPVGCEWGGADSVERGAEAWAAAMEEMDVESALGWYERSAAFLPPGEAAVVGRGSIRDRWERVLDRFEVSYGWELDTVEAAGTRLGYVYGSYRVSGVDQATGESFQVDDTFVQVWRRQRDGSWLIALDMWHPPAQEVRGLPVGR